MNSVGTGHEQDMRHGIVSARSVRRILRDAGLDQLVEKVSSGRRTCYVRLHWNMVAHPADGTTTDADQVAAAITEAYAMHGHTRPARPVYSSCVAVQRWRR